MAKRKPRSESSTDAPQRRSESPTDTPSKQQSQPKAKRRRRRRPRSREEAPTEVPSEVESKAAAEPPAETRSKPAAEPPVETRSKPAAEPPAETRSKPAAEKRSKPSPKPEPTVGFDGLGLSETTLEALAAAEYLEPTPVQAGLIPLALEGIDLMGQARTGTGKTAAFAIPILEQLKPHKRGAWPQALILTPTRELAVQVRDECSKLAAGSKAHVVATYGGKPIRHQIEQLARGAEIVVGTPGRVIDLSARGALVLSEVRFVVLDEADRMLDIGFRPDIEKILRRCPQSRQTLLLSATIPPPVMRLAQRYMRDPQMLDFSPKNPAVETIEQFYFTVDPEKKFELLVKLVERENPTQAIVFCRTKRGTDKLQRRLSRKIKSVDTIHGDLSQPARDAVMRSFRDGRTRILVATDVVGRGIDVTRISHIINFDVPQFCDDYVHRVGRTGRMGREGVAFTFVSPEEGNELTRIEMRINLLLKRGEVPGFDAFDKPEATEEIDIDEETGRPLEAPDAKPIYGRRRRRHRKAL